MSKKYNVLATYNVIYQEVHEFEVGAESLVNAQMETLMFLPDDNSKIKSNPQPKYQLDTTIKPSLRLIVGGSDKPSNKTLEK